MDENTLVEQSDELTGQNTGTSGDDLLVGDNGDNTLAGGEGNDTLRGNGGNDFLQAEQDNDRFFANRDSVGRVDNAHSTNQKSFL